jgi:hypothetical protein
MALRQRRGHDHQDKPARRPDQQAAGDADGGRRRQTEQHRPAADSGERQRQRAVAAEARHEAFAEQTADDEPGRQRCWVQADHSVAEGELVAQERDDVALDAEEIREQGEREIVGPGDAVAPEASGQFAGRRPLSKAHRRRMVGHHRPCFVLERSS